MTVLAIVIVAIVLVAGAIVVSVMQRHRSRRLQERFGPEYQRVVEDAGSRRDAEAELAGREERRSALAIRTLEPDARRDYVSAWQGVQAQFVDDPSDAVGRADRLVHQVMGECGYPVDAFEQQAADVSVDHPTVVTDYRAAHEISLRNDAGSATTEDLRRAMVHYRALFDDLLLGETAHTR
jgi:hypothetical protein